MLTVNADDHPFMRQFHAPEDEKRMVVILDPEQFEGWLTCSVAEAKTRYCKQWHGQLAGEPAPLPARPRSAKGTSRAQPKEPFHVVIGKAGHGRGEYHPHQRTESQNAV